jgi:hypothetical protein
MTTRRLLVFLAMVLAAAGMFPVVSTQPGAHAVAMAQAFLTFYSGVFSLVAFTGAVVWGLIAAERIVPVRYRVLAQGVHRMLALLGLGFLGTHIVLQILSEHAHIVDAFIPFLDTEDRLVATGLGTIASDLMIVVYAVGKLRGRFVNASRPWVWRIVHGIAYLSWPIAITHGLTAGRPVKGSWVTVSYVVCLCLVVIALLIRLYSPFPALRSARRAPGERGRRPETPPAPRQDNRQGAPQSGRPTDRPTGGQGDKQANRQAGRPRAPKRPRPAAPARPSTPLPSLGNARPPERGTGPIPRTTGPLPRTTGPIPRTPSPVERNTGPLPRTTGPLPRTPSPVERNTGPLPRTTGPLPAATGSLDWTTGPLPRTPGPEEPDTGPLGRSRPPEYARPGAAPRAPAPSREGREARRERLLIPDRPDAERAASAPNRPGPDESRQPRHWLDAVERFPLFRRPQRGSRPRPIVEPDIDEVEFWANLRAETAVWIRRGRR